MRPGLLTLCALSLAACWADFPPELLRPDQSQDLPSDLGPDRPHDQPRSERAPDLRRDAVVDARSDRDAPRLDGREAGGDLAPSDALADARVLLALGTPCKKDLDCTSNHCEPRSGLCCNAACAGSCMTCALAGQEGRCSFVPAGVDPHGDCAAASLASCGLDGTCDGRGACRKHLAGTLVAAASCSGLALEKVTLASYCDGKGNLLPGAELTCDPYTCDPASRRCRPSCASTTECATGPCQAQKCNGKTRSQGASCTKNAECASGACVDGVCCESACGQPCQRCNLAGLEGTCSPAFAGTDPDNDCTAGPGPCAGLDGQCDGLGACRAWVEGTPCATASCIDAELTLHGSCASGACLKSTASCGSYACLPAGDGCWGFCTKDEHCKPGCTCNTAGWSCEGSC
jgi:hypothetical protein